MLISRSAERVISKKLVKKLPLKPIDKQFFKDGVIDYELIQKELIEAHLIAFNYFKLMLEIGLECGCRENVLAANLGMITHSKQIVALSGMDYFAEINAAAARLEKEGYSIGDVID